MNSKLLDEDDIKDLINESLFEKGLINEEVYEKCGKKPHISSLPGDLRTNDSDKLQERKDELNKRIKKQKEIIKELSDKEKKSKAKLDEWGDFLREDIDKIDNNLRTVFEDHFGKLGTDQPEMDLRDLFEGGLIGARERNARVNMMNDWYKLYNDFEKFNSKLDTAITKRKDKASLDKIISSFYKKLNRFNKKYDKFRKNYGPGIYMGRVMRGFTEYHPSDIAYRELNSAFRNTDGNDFSLSKLYGSYHDSWTSVKSDLKKEKGILKDYQDEVKRINDK